jgi:hypothetical protein
VEETSLTVGKKLGQENLVGGKQSDGLEIALPEARIIRTVKLTA